MNAAIVRALLADAFYQVVDNMIFRLLLLIVLAIVAFFFLVGFRESEIQVLYGWQTISYESFFATVGQSARGIADVQGLMIQGLQTLIVQTLAGSMAMVFCISATAFFVPRMLEKGSADILFSKPVSRTTLLLSRYFAGLIFVGLLSFVLLLGVYLGLLLVSGYSDPGFVFGVLTLVYLFAILHAFSLLVGVLTRSTVAAILTSILLYMITGGIHSGWRLYERNDVNDRKRIASASFQEETQADAAESTSPEKRENAFLAAVRATVYGLHYVLPKTSDADILTRKLRKSIDTQPLKVVDAEANFTLVDALKDLNLNDASAGTRGSARLELVSPDPSTARGGVVAVDLSKAPAVWSLTGEQKEKWSARIEISRRSSQIAPPADAAGSSKARPRKLNTNGAVDELVAKLKLDKRLIGQPATHKVEVDGRFAMLVEWAEAGDTAPRSLTAVLFIYGGWVFEVRLSSEAAWDGNMRTTVVERFLQRVSIGDELAALDTESWYEKQFTLSAPWNYNILFSIGSSLAFIVVMLGLARWRLQRIDF